MAATKPETKILIETVWENEYGESKLGMCAQCQAVIAKTLGLKKIFNISETMQCSDFVCAKCFDSGPTARRVAYLDAELRHFADKRIDESMKRV